MRRDLIVPKGKCPLDILAEQGEKIRNTWIFLHVSVVYELATDEKVIIGKAPNGGQILFWEATEMLPEIRIVSKNFEGTVWHFLTNASIGDIAFDVTEDVKEPEDIIFVKMEGAA